MLKLTWKQTNHEHEHAIDLNMNINRNMNMNMYQILAENFDCVTIFFGDIIGFNELTSDCTANEVTPPLQPSVPFDYFNTYLL